jgi:hypothetical protein
MVHSASGDFALGAGMVFALPGAGSLSGYGTGMVVSRYGYKGFFQIGGPVEDRGRLKYIDGCTDSLLVPPVMLGDPCLNLLYFPAGSTRRSSTHPSMRVGIVASGSACASRHGREIRAFCRAGFFVIHAGTVLTPSATRRTSRCASSPTIPTAISVARRTAMTNRTLVNGSSASLLAEIHTR